MANDLDLSTPQSTRKALHDINDRQRELAKRGDSLDERIAEKEKALTAISKRLAEFENAKAFAGNSDGDAGLNKYIKRDGTVRVRGESSDLEAFTPGLLDDAPVCDWQKDLQDAVDDRNLMRMIRKGKSNPKTENRLADVLRRAPNPEVARIFGDIATSGAEFIPDVMLPSLDRKLTAQRRLVANFDTITMQNKNQILPYLTTGYRPFLRGTISGDDPGQFTSSSMVTSNKTITAQSFAVRAQVDADASEDSILAALPLIRTELATALVDAEEDAVVNADNAATHQDAIASWNARGRWGSASSANDHRKAWQGLRARSYDVSSTFDFGSSTENFAGIMAARSGLDSPHGVEGDVILVISPEMYLKVLIQLAEVKSLSDFGPNYSALSGQVSVLAGMPVIVSEFLTADLNATGLYTGAGSTSGMLIVNRQRFKMGRLGAAGGNVELDKDISRGVFDVVATMRSAFYTPDPATSVKNVVYGFNMDGS